MKALRLTLVAVLLANLWYKFNWLLCFLILVDIILNAVSIVNVRKRNQKYHNAAVKLNHLNKRIDQYEQMQNADRDGKISTHKNFPDHA